MGVQSNKVLFLTTILPSQRLGGGEVASQAFIDGLRENGCAVSVVGYMRKDEAFTPSPYELVVEKRYIETHKAKAYAVLWFFVSLLMGLPYSAAKYYSRAYVRLVKSLLTAQAFDIVIIDHSQLGWLTELLSDQMLSNRCKVIFIAHNSEHDVYMSHCNTSDSFLKRWLYAREARLIQALELAVSKRAAEIWTLTDSDASYFSGLTSGLTEKKSRVKALALPSVPSTQVEQSIEKKFDIGLIGRWTWKFNEEGLRWFFERVYPELPGELSIHVAGKGAEWLSGKYSNVQYEGFVPDAQVFMAQARVVALPMQGGSGIQIKSLDALASGSAIVATPVSMRGISFGDSMVKTAEHPKDFACSLSLELEHQSLRKGEDAMAISLEWLRTRREQFLHDLASSIGYRSNTVPSVNRRSADKRKPQLELKEAAIK